MRNIDYKMINVRFINEFSEESLRNKIINIVNNFESTLPPNKWIDIGYEIDYAVTNTVHAVMIEFYGKLNPDYQGN